MVGNLVSWLNRKLAGKTRQTPEEMERLLSLRSSAEIAARLLRRAELHDGGNDYLQRCAVLDRVAAENLRMMVLRDTNQDTIKWLDARDLCLRLLREGKN